MKTMKKLLVLMLAAAMLLSIAACAATTNDPTPSTDPAPAAEEPTQTAGTFRRKGIARGLGDQQRHRNRPVSARLCLGPSGGRLYHHILF